MRPILGAHKDPNKLWWKYPSEVSHCSISSFPHCWTCFKLNSLPSTTSLSSNKNSSKGMKSLSLQKLRATLGSKTQKRFLQNTINFTALEKLQASRSRFSLCYEHVLSGGYKSNGSESTSAGGGGACEFWKSHSTALRKKWDDNFAFSLQYLLNAVVWNF